MKQNEFKINQRVRFTVGSMGVIDAGLGKGLKNRPQNSVTSGTIIGFEQQGGDLKLKVRLDRLGKFQMLIHPSQILKN